MKKSRDYIHFLEDIYESIKRIRKYTVDYTFDDFVADQKTIDAVIRNFEILGEAVKNLPKELKEKYSAVPWEEMYRFRNKIIYEYFGIDYSIVWHIISTQLHENEEMIKEVLEKEKG